MSEHMKNIAFYCIPGTGASVTWMKAVDPNGQTAGGPLFVEYAAQKPANDNPATAKTRLTS